MDSDNSIVTASTGRVEGAQNNNRAELTAFINALHYVRANRGQFVLHVDYEALYLYCNGQSKPKANKDLYREIDRIIRSCDTRVTVVKVEAHKTKSSIVNFINGIVDKLARRSIEHFGTEGIKAFAR